MSDSTSQAPSGGAKGRKVPRRRRTSAASAGGAAGASGVGLQNRVFGWAAAAMTAEKPLLIPTVVAGAVVRVGAQTGYALDDVAVQTDADNFALFQVKAGLGLGTAEGSPLAEALEQAVKQYLDGPLRAPDGTERPVDPVRDALVLCTDSAAPATVRRDLAKAVTKTASQPPGTPLGHELTEQQVKALNVVLAHVRRLWEAAKRPAPDDEKLRKFLRVLRVITIDANDGEPDHAAAVALLSTTLPVPGDADAAWPVLVAEGQAASVGQDWRDRSAIGNALSRHGVQLSPPVRHSGDIARLGELSASNLGRLQSEAELPVPGGLYIARGVSARLAADAGAGNVLIVGDAGAGKSAVAQEFVTERSGSQEVVVLRAVDIAGANRVQLDAPLSTVLRAWTGQTGVVLIDGVDALRGSEDRAFLSDVVTGLSDSRWQVVATARTFDARNNHELQQAFSGPPISHVPAEVDGRLPGVRHLLVGDLTDAELDDAVKPPLALASLLAEASPELRALLRNPFNLRLAAGLAEHMSGSQDTELLAARSRVDLLETYWNRRVRNEDSTAREALLTRLCRAMVSSRRLRVVEAEPTVTAADSRAVDAMLSENVLSNDTGLPAARRVLSFSHNIQFDYAVALYLLHDPLDPSSELLGALDADPSLPLVARPSFEMLADLLWKHRDTGMFWPLCLNLAGSSHVLASLAFPTRVVNLIGVVDDLAPLAPEPGRVDSPDGMWPAQQFVRQLVGALRTPAVVADAAPAVAALAALARRLAGNSTNSYIDGALAADLLIGLQLRAPLTPDNPDAAGADDRGHAVAALLDGCRTDPQRMEQLAGAAARQLPHVIGTSAAARAATDRLLGDTDALQEWGGTVLTWLADAVVPAIPAAPELARRIAGAVLTFRETRDEQVSFGGGVLLPLTQSRQQQAGQGAYRLVQSFAQLCAADLRIAAEVFCDLAEDGTQQQASDQWPMAAPGAVGWLQYGRDLSTTTRKGIKTAATALSAALASIDPIDAQPVLAVLVQRLHNAAAWAALITPASTELARILLPVLESGALLAHPQTHPAAAHLVAELSEHEPGLADRLEAAVLQAHALLDANGGSQWTKDTLIGCLRADAITSAALTDRLAELGPDGPPDIPQKHATAGVMPWSPVDELIKQQESPVAAAAAALSDELKLITSGTDDRPESKRRLHELFTDADAAFATQASLPQGLQRLLVDAAAVLARDSRVLPGTPLGTRILALLTAAATSTDEGKFHQ